MTAACSIAQSKYYPSNNHRKHNVRSLSFKQLHRQSSPISVPRSLKNMKPTHAIPSLPKPKKKKPTNGEKKKKQRKKDTRTVFRVKTDLSKI